MTKTQLIGLLSLLALSVPAFAANSADDFDHHHPGGGWGHHGCYNQREVEFSARRFTEQAERFRGSVEHARGYERLAEGASRLIDAARDFSFRIERARDCREISYEFNRVEDVFYRVERHYNEIRRRERDDSRFIEEDFRHLSFAFRELRDNALRDEHRPFPGRPLE